MMAGYVRAECWLAACISTGPQVWFLVLKETTANTLSFATYLLAKNPGNISMLIVLWTVPLTMHVFPACRMSKAPPGRDRPAVHRRYEVFLMYLPPLTRTRCIGACHRYGAYTIGAQQVRVLRRKWAIASYVSFDRSVP